MVFLQSARWVVTILIFIHHATSAYVDRQKVLSPSSLLDHMGTIDITPGANDDLSLEKRFGFDIDWNDYYDHLTIRESLVGGPSNHNNVSGMIAFVKGEPEQRHSFEVLVRAISPHQSSLDCLEFPSNKSSLSIITRPQCVSIAPKTHINIDIIIAVRPRALQFGGVGTRVHTNFLSIVIWRDLSFETYYMTLHSTYGTVECHETFYFTAHSISVSSDYGNITGNWSLPSSIALSTTHGTIDIDLPPKRWSAGPDTTGAIAAHSLSGDIHIRMPFAEDQLSLRNSTANITTTHGAVHATLVHGAVTHIQSVSGTINATLLPYWAFDEFQGVQHNYISTICSTCKMTVDVLSPIVDDYYKIPPLLFSKSRHVAGSGVVGLRYPRNWAGVAEWKVGHGVVNVSGSDYEEVKREGLSGKIQRRPLGSELYAEVGLGMLELLMKA